MADVDEDFFDEWLIKTLKAYRHLHMFDLPQPTCVIEWNEKDGICVAGCSPNSRNEILEMSLPAKLLRALDGKGRGLTKDRDFKVGRGGFSDAPIHCLKYLRGTVPRLIVTGSHTSQDLDVWQLGSESSNIIKKVSTQPGRGVEGRGIRAVAQRPGHRGQVVFGSTLSDVQVVDVEMRRVIAADFGKTDDLVEMQFLGENELVTCSAGNGTINIHDLRTTSSQSGPSNQHTNYSAIENESCTKDEGTTSEQGTNDQSQVGLETSVPEGTNRGAPKKEEISWTFDLSCAPAAESSSGEDTVLKKPKLDAALSRIICLCSNGEVITKDLRDLQTPLQSVKLNDTQMYHGKTEPLTVKWCPTEKNLLSVSGLTGCVDIYDTSQWHQCSTCPPIVKPVFSHEGHMMGEASNQQARILCHTWHPSQSRVVMSSGSDGSLHAWDWSAVS